MKKIRWIWISLLAAGALTALVALGGCSRQGSAGLGFRGGRHGTANEAAVSRRGEGRELRGAPVERVPQSRGRSVDAETGRQSRAADTCPGRQAGGQRYAQKAEPESNGRSVAETGKLADLSGSLDSRDSEWYLVTEQARWALHLGNISYVESTGIQLRPGAPVKVRGFVDGEEVAVVTILIDGQLFAFRTEDGVPLWAGRGRQAGTGSRSGRGGGGARISG